MRTFSSLSDFRQFNPLYLCTSVVLTILRHLVYNNINVNRIIFQISETATLGDDTEQFLTHLLIVGVIFVYLFLANHAGQEIMDHNDYVFSTA